MAEGHTTISRIRRLAVVVGTLCVLAAVAAPTSAAQLVLSESGPPEPTETGLEAQLPEPTASIPETAGLVSQVSEESLPEATTNTLTHPTEPPAQTTAPAPLQQTQLLPASVETLAAATESAVQPVAEALPVVETATQPLLQQTLAPLASVVETTEPVRGVLEGAAATDASSAANTPVEAGVSAAAGRESSLVAPVSDLPAAFALTPSDRVELTEPTRRAEGIPLTGSDSRRFPALPSLPGGAENTTGNSTGAKASPSPYGTTPAPLAPGGPLSGLASASAAAGAGALLPLLAALAAALLLAAPGLGRRLRLRLAPWPQPILQLSLERPG